MDEYWISFGRSFHYSVIANSEEAAERIAYQIALEDGYKPYKGYPSFTTHKDEL